MRKMHKQEGPDGTLSPARINSPNNQAQDVVGEEDGLLKSPSKQHVPHLDLTNPMNWLTALDGLPRTTKFCLLVVGLFSFFGVHNYLQESIMHFPGFTYGWYLGFLEVLGVTVFSFAERKLGGESGRQASLKAYAATTLCLMGSSSLSNIALNYINYPTKVVFRSCKLIPTMIIAGCINKRNFTGVEYVAALAVSLGLVVFAFADFTVSPSFNIWGIVLVCLSVVCDAVLPNLQEKLFRAGSSRLEVTFYSNVFTLAAMAGSMLLSGDLVGATVYAAKNQEAAMYMLIYTLLAYVAISLHMSMVKQFGSVAAVLVGNSRKTMTICMSFIMFPKPFTPEYAVGGLMVLAGLTVSAYVKNQQKGGRH